MPPAMKRKLDAVQGDENNENSVDARKSILDMSMVKLCSAPPRKVEPSLRRSVLIVNTLRHIEAQLRREGVNVGHAQSQQLQPVMRDNRDVVMEMAPPPVLSAAAAPTMCCGHSNPVMCQCTYSRQCYSDQSTLQSTGKSPCATYQSLPPVSIASNLNCSSQYSPNDYQVHKQSACCQGQPSQSQTVPSGPCAEATVDIVSSMENAHLTTPSTSSPVTRPVYSHQPSSASSCSMSMSATETLYSDTTKMLDSLLNSDRLVAVASFTSLFDVDTFSPLGSNHGASDTPTYTNCESQNQGLWGSQECLSFTTSSSTDHWSALPRPVAMVTECSPWSAGNTTTTSTAGSAATSTYQELSAPPSVLHTVSNIVPPSQHSTVISSTCSVLQPICSQSSPASYSPLPSPPLTCRQECDAASVNASTLADIDCNMFDFDLYMPSLSPSMKLTPLNHDDLANSLPSTDAPTFTSPAWSPKSEHITDDLDHIMQILVGL